LKNNKTLYRALLLAGFILINAGILFGISQVIAYLNTGADRSKMLHLDLKQERFYIPDVTWESEVNPGRPMEEANRKKIEQDYLDAWHIKNTSFFTGKDAGITDHFTKNAREKIVELLAQNMEDQTYIQATTLSHHITLEFYSADGTIAVLTDRNVAGIERMFKNDKFLFERYFKEDYKIILLLEDGFWKIRHFEKTAIHKDPQKLVTVSPDQKLLEGINYYPQMSPWDTFGENFDVSILSNDFKIIKDLNLNSIRVFVGYDDFGKAIVSEEKLNKLELLLNEADKAKLKVIVTLFDFYGDYRLQDYTLTNRHMKTIVNHIKNHPAILAWDLKNEPNLDFDSRGEREVLSWLEQSISYLKHLDQVHPVTIGWSSPEAAMYLVDKVDVISYHYYQDLKDLSSAHKKLTSATNKPVVLQEFGMSSYYGMWNLLGNDEEDQAAYYKRFFETQKRDSINYLSWTLFDFGEIPSRVAGKLPWRKNKQAFFGLIDIDGEKDDAYLVIKNR